MPWELDAVLEPEVVRAGLRRLCWRQRVPAMLQGGPKNPLARVALLEAGLYLRNQLLRDTDWASMAHSLEVRVPLVDFALLRRAGLLALRRPLGGKRLLAASLTRPLPDNVLQRAKTGFVTPIERWMDRLGGPPDQREPWARRWARIVAHTMLPEDALRRSPAHPPSGAPFTEMA
jgi:asparagine synthase (glutamine-hydrolysing)